MKSGLLLTNLGTPDSPSVRDVRKYLRQFLSDPRVLDMPAVKRPLILNLFILPRRPRSSAAAYRKIWSDRGSPLRYYGDDLVAKVQRLLNAKTSEHDEEIPVVLGMRYGNPSIPAALETLKAAGVDRIVALPLYPQYSASATGSTVDELNRTVSRYWNTPFLEIIPPFYQHPAYLEASIAIASPVLQRARPECVLFAFHGLPERHCRQSDESPAARSDGRRTRAKQLWKSATNTWCLKRRDCCERLNNVNRLCYRAQCVATARSLAQGLGISADDYIVCFQSRLGREPWIKPYTDQVLGDLARKGRKRILVLTPSFVTDCLETLEEIGIRAREDWLNLGGDHLALAPCLNASDVWAQAILTMIGDRLQKWPPSPSTG